MGATEAPLGPTETVGWTTRRREYPLPAQRAEGEGEGLLQPVELAYGQCLQGLSLSPLHRRGEREKTLRKKRLSSFSVVLSYGLLSKRLALRP